MKLFLDAESHILFFDIEGLIVELHSEEYAAMSPTTLEVSFFGFCSQLKTEDLLCGCW